MKRTKEQWQHLLDTCIQDLEQSKLTKFSELNSVKHFWFAIVNRCGEFSMLADSLSHRWSGDTYYFDNLSAEEVGQLMGGN